MSRIASLNQRYAASADIVRHGVEVVTVGDPAGARLNAAVRRLMMIMRDDGPDLWEDLAAAAKALRWRAMTQPQPIDANPALVEAIDHVQRQARRLRDAVADVSLLDELAAASSAIGESDSPVGATLMRSIEEVGPAECVVVAASNAAQAALSDWLAASEVLVLTPGAMERAQPSMDQSYVVGPPRFFRSSIVTAPVTSGVSFILPAWFGDRSIPCSALAAYAEGAIRVTAKVFTEGDVSEPEGGPVIYEAESEDDFLPQPSWGGRRSIDREPGVDEVVAHKVLLSGNLAIWLDDGDHIRALDPSQPPGERVVYTEVAAIRRGTYLLLRQGETERGALHRAAVERLPVGKKPAVEGAQKAWKDKLARRMEQFSYRRTVNELRARGVKAADRARAWTDPSLVRPNRDEDFEALLLWLAIPVQPTFGYATMLRRAHHQASAALRERLERTVSEADLSTLERDGHWALDGRQEGVRGLVATRVLAISPHTEIVSRSDARVLFEDRSGQWLE